MGDCFSKDLPGICMLPSVHLNTREQPFNIITVSYQYKIDWYSYWEKKKLAERYTEHLDKFFFKTLLNDTD